MKRIKNMRTLAIASMVTFLVTILALTLVVANFTLK